MCTTDFFYFFLNHQFYFHFLPSSFCLRSRNARKRCGKMCRMGTMKRRWTVILPGVMRNKTATVEMRTIMMMWYGGLKRPKNLLQTQTQSLIWRIWIWRTWTKLWGSSQKIPQVYWNLQMQFKVSFCYWCSNSIWRTSMDSQTGKVNCQHVIL